MNHNLIIAAILVYVAWGTIIAVYSRRGLQQGVVDYFLGGRQLKGVVAALSYSATTFSAFMLLGLAGLTYRGGVGAYGFEIVYLSGLVLAVVFGPRFWKAGRRFGCVSPTELFSIRFGHPLTGMVAAGVCLIFLVPYASVQLMGIGYLLETLSGGSIGFLSGVLAATLLAFLWTEIAGLRSVATTDSLQAAVMFTGSTILVLFVISRVFGGFGAFARVLEHERPLWLSVPGPGYFNFQTFFGLSLPWFFFSISNPQVSQRFFVTASLGKLRSMIGGFLLFGFFYTIITILIGFFSLVLFPDLPNPDQATPHLLANLPIPPLLVLLVAIGIFSAAISTIDSVLLTLSSMWVRDIVNRRQSISEARQLQIARVSIPVLCLILFLFARLRLDLIAVLSVTSSAGLLSVVPSIFGTFFWKRGNARSAIVSMLGGALVSLLFQVLHLRPLGLWPGFWTLVTAGTLFVVLGHREPTEAGERFLKKINS